MNSIVKSRLLFVSPRFLFPLDSGGKIRTSQILRGLKGGMFHITLASPGSTDGTFANQIDGVCDRFVNWSTTRRERTFRALRAGFLLSGLPVSVATDRSVNGKRTIAELVDEQPDVVVFDFAHAEVLAPAQLTCPSVIFTHNVEAEILRRQFENARTLLARLAWRDQHRKMIRFERAALQRFDTVIAVSERDAKVFNNEYGVRRAEVIPTGTDLQYFRYGEPATAPIVAFIGSMDWGPNIDGVRFFLREIWPLITVHRPDAKMTVIGRYPPAWLVSEATEHASGWTFTGSVPDVRPFVRAAAVCVIPLRIGGGTRIKAFEAMALGCPVVSTSLGVEGLNLSDPEHCLLADEPLTFATAILRLIEDRGFALGLSRRGRAHVERHASSDLVAKRFEEICVGTIERRGM